MNKLVIAAVLLLSACASTGQPASRQAQFDQACKYGMGATEAIKPLMPVISKLLEVKVGMEAVLALDSAFQTVRIACSVPLDVSNQADIVQRVYDAAGKVVELVLKAQTGA